MIPHLDDLTEQRRLKTCDPYKEVVQIVTDHHTILGDFIAWIYTPILGFDVVFCEYDGYKHDFIWETDWYEGGQVYLIAYAFMPDIEFDITQKWHGYKEGETE